MDTVKRRAVPAGRCLNVEAIEPVGYKTGIRIHQGAAIDHDWQLFGNQPQTASGRFWPMDCLMRFPRAAIRGGEGTLGQTMGFEKSLIKAS